MLRILSLKIQTAYLTFPRDNNFSPTQRVPSVLKTVLSCLQWARWASRSVSLTLLPSLCNFCRTTATIISNSRRQHLQRLRSSKKTSTRRAPIHWRSMNLLILLLIIEVADKNIQTSASPYLKRRLRSGFATDMDPTRAIWASKNITWWTSRQEEPTSYSSASNVISKRLSSAIWSITKRRTARKNPTSAPTAATPSSRLATATGTTWAALAWLRAQKSNALSYSKTSVRQKQDFACLLHLLSNETTACRTLIKHRFLVRKLRSR